MIIPIRNQPITFEGVEAGTATCGDISQYCQMVRLGDKLCFQLRQESCLPQLLCNNDFSVFGTDVLAGAGDFYNSSEYSEWDGDPDTWEFDSYGHRACTIEGHAGSPLTWALDLYALSTDCTYILSFEISGHEEPGGEEADTDLTVTLPDGTTQIISADGAYAFPTGVGASFSFTPGLNWTGCIDNVTLLCGGVCWNFDFPIPEKNPVSLSGSGLCKVLDYETTVTEQTGTLEIGKYYQIVVKVEGSSDGFIEFFLGTVSIGTTDENGIFTLSGVSDGTEFSFTMSEFFDGCIMYISLYELSKNYTLKLKNAETGALMLDITDNLLFGEEIKAGTRGDLIQACISFNEAMLGTLIPYFTNNSVCMYLEIESPVDGDVITSGTFTLSNSVSILDDWGFTGTLEYDDVQGQVELNGGTGFMLQDMSGGGFVQGNTYYVSFDLNCLVHDTGAEFDSFTLSIGSASDGTGGEMVWNASNFPTAPGHYVYKVVAGTDGDYLAFMFDDSFGLSSICLDNVKVTTTPCPYEIYQSNCIKFMNENEGVLGWEGSKLVTACNEDAGSFGLDWSTGFKLQSRLFLDIISPRYPSKEDETYLQSNGVRERVYADSSKVFDLNIHAVDELTHDYIRTMLKCDILYIDDGYTLTNRYISLEAEYSPNHDPKGRLTLTDATVEVQKYDNTIFNTNCR